MVGVLSGAVTNTPGMGAAQQTFYDMTGEVNTSIAQGYAVTYPLGVVGVILSIIVLKRVFRVNFDNERRIMMERNKENAEQLEAVTLEVHNDSVCGRTIREIQELFSRKCVITRVLHERTHDIELAESTTTLGMGDKIFIVASPFEIEALTLLIGPRINMNMAEWDAIEANNLTSERCVITNPQINGKRLGDLKLRQTFNVTITRIIRAGVDLIADPHLLLQLGDRIVVVGKRESIKKIAELMGNSVKRLDEPNLTAIFLGIALGVVLGSIPIFIPNVPVPVKFGLAGGPLIVSILISKFGPQMKLVTYTTSSANKMIRQIGITLFLASVGIGAGDGFVDTLVDGGYWWVLYGFLITTLPCLVIGVIARVKLKLSFFTIAGLVSGTMTNPPALAYSNEVCGNNQASVAYSTVYPLTMFLRVVTAQILVLMAL
jgi:putative transport protein